MTFLISKVLSLPHFLFILSVVVLFSFLSVFSLKDSHSLFLLTETKSYVMQNSENFFFNCLALKDGFMILLEEGSV